MAFIAAMTSCTTLQDFSYTNSHPGKTSFPAETQKVREQGGEILYTLFLGYNEVFANDNLPTQLKQANSYFCEYLLNDERYAMIVAYEDPHRFTPLVCTTLKIKGYYTKESEFSWVAAVVDQADQQEGKLFMISEGSLVIVFRKGTYGRVFKGSASGLHVPRN